MFKFTKSGLLKKQKKLIEGLILQVEIDIEVEWMLMNRAQKEIGELQKEIDKNIKEIEDEKKKTPMDMEKIKKIVQENVDLGYNPPDLTGKKGDPMYGGKIAKFKEIVRFHHNEVNKKAGEREYHKLRLKAVNRMLKTGYMKHFDEILETNEEISFRK